MRQIDIEYNFLVKSIQTYGSEVRGTMSLPHLTISTDLSKDFPILACRKLNPDLSLAEVNWWFSPEHDQVSGLPKRYQEIWEPFSTDGYLETSYGKGIQKHWDFCREEVLAGGRRAVLDLWDLTSVYAFQPPCHTSIVFSRYGDQLHCMVMARSQDVLVGLPYDLMNYAILTQRMASETGLVAKQLTICMADPHIYLRDIPKMEKMNWKSTYSIPKWDGIKLEWDYQPPSVPLKAEVSMSSH